MPIRRYIPFFAFFAIILLAWSVQAEGGHSSAVKGDLDLNIFTAKMQRALSLLQGGDYVRAERMAVKIAGNASGEASARAWMVCGEARKRRGKFPSAVSAFVKCVSATSSRTLKRFASERAEQCRKMSKNPQRHHKYRKYEKYEKILPSENLTEDDLLELAHTDDAVHTVFSEHFEVQANNGLLASIISQQAESELKRISEMFPGCFQTLPKGGKIVVHPRREDYLANGGPDYSSGCFRHHVPHDESAGQRIDLVQTDENLNFSTDLLDRILPHEICHLLIREFFGEYFVPPMIDEGMAMLAEHGTDNMRIVLVGSAIESESAIPLELLAIPHAADESEREMFYAESWSFMEFIRSRLSDEQFREFLEQMRNGLGVSDAIKRVLLTPWSMDFEGYLSEAWKAYAVRQFRFIRAIQANRAKSSSDTDAAKERNSNG